MFIAEADTWEGRAAQHIARAREARKYPADFWIDWREDLIYALMIVMMFGGRSMRREARELMDFLVKRHGSPRV